MKGICDGAVENALGHLTGNHQPLCHRFAGCCETNTKSGIDPK